MEVLHESGEVEKYRILFPARLIKGFFSLLLFLIYTLHLLYEISIA